MAWRGKCNNANIKNGNSRRGLRLTARCENYTTKTHIMERASRWPAYQLLRMCHAFRLTFRHGLTADALSLVKYVMVVTRRTSYSEMHIMDVTRSGGAGGAFGHKPQQFLDLPVVRYETRCGCAIRRL